MRPASPPRRTPYWTLPALAVLIALPYPWGIVAAVGLLAGATLLGAARGALRRWAAAAAAGRAGEGVALGVDAGGAPVILSERQLAAHGLIVGASGAGKTTTLLAIAADRIARGRPVVAIDLKGSPAFAAELERHARAAGRPLHVWTPEGPAHWNPLADGNPTVLKDKLIASERYTEPHYQRAAERYLQAVIGVLHAARPGHAATLQDVVALMEPRRLRRALERVDAATAERVGDYLSALTGDQLSAIRGLGTRLALLSESQAGPYLAPAPAGAGEATIDLRRALAGEQVVLFSLNSSLYGKLAAQLGTLAVQDLVSAVGERLARAGAEGAGAPQALIAIDEFSALQSDNVLALLARGREAGAAVLLCTQELADLERAGSGLRDQILGITAVKLAHRQDVPASAHTVAQMIGTERVWEETVTIRSPLARGSAARGSRRQVERFVVHPDQIKSLGTGQAVLIAKAPEPRVAHLRVTPPAHVRVPPPARGAPTAAGQPEPGVTR